MEGWIKLHRKIQVSPLYRSLNSKQRDIMMQILLMASHAENEWVFKGQLYRVKPGQFITSLETLEEKCASDVSVQNIRTCLLKLEKGDFLTSESTNKNRLITVLNWELYQGGEENQQADQQSSNKQLTTINNVKNVKEKKKKDIVPNGTTRNNFIPPNLEEIETYCEERNSVVDPETFYNFYTMKGWVVGKNKMKDWKAAVRHWETRDKPKPKERDKVIASRDRDIALQRWVNDGNDPDLFNF